MRADKSLRMRKRAAIAFVVMFPVFTVSVVARNAVGALPKYRVVEVTHESLSIFTLEMWYVVGSIKLWEKVDITEGQ